MLDNFLLKLFDKYADLLKQRFSGDFQEVKFAISLSSMALECSTLRQIVSTDDYMPMAINTVEEYEKVVNVSWFSQDKMPNELA